MVELKDFGILVGVASKGTENLEVVCSHCFSSNVIAYADNAPTTEASIKRVFLEKNRTTVGNLFIGECKECYTKYYCTEGK